MDYYGPRKKVDFLAEKKINYNHLRCFWIVAAVGSIKEASQYLHISQPTISEQIKCLEYALGESLFTRKSRALSLTDRGSILFNDLNKHFRSLEASLTSFLDMRSHKELKIGISETVCGSFTNDIISKLLKQNYYPVTYSIDFSKSNLFNNLNSFDMIISESGPNNESLLIPNNYTSLNFQRSFHLVCSSQVYSKSKGRLSELTKRFHFIGYTRKNHLTRYIEGMMNLNSINPTYLCETNDLDLMIALTCDHKGYAVLPELAIQHYLKDRQLLIIPPSPFLSVNTNMVVINEHEAQNIAKLLAPGALKKEPLSAGNACFEKHVELT